MNIKTITVHIECSNGNSWTTGFNGSFEDAERYFLGREFVSEDANGKEFINMPISIEECLSTTTTTTSK